MLRKSSFFLFKSIAWEGFLSKDFITKNRQKKELPVAILLLFIILFIFSWNSVIQNIEAKFEDYLNAESRVNRTTVQDTRVHCCLYFIAPTGHGWVWNIVSSLVFWSCSVLIKVGRRFTRLIKMYARSNCYQNIGMAVSKTVSTVDSLTAVEFLHWSFCFVQQIFIVFFAISD